MVSLNRRLGRNVFGSILLLAIFSCTLFNGTAFSEDAEEAVPAQSKYDQAETLFKSGKFAEAKALYEYVPQNSSDSNLIFWAQEQAIRCEISLGNDTAVEQAITEFKKDSAQNIELFPALLIIADHYYYKTNKFSKAKELYRDIAINSPDSNCVFMGQTRVIGCEMALGNYSAADQAIEVFKGDKFEDEYQLFEIFLHAKKYYELGKFDKAKDLFEYVSQKSPDNKLSLEADNGAARCSTKMRQSCTVEQAAEMLNEENVTEEVFVDKAISICSIFIHKNDPATALPYINRALKSTTDNKKKLLLLSLKTECYIELDAKEQAVAVQQEMAPYSSEEGYLSVRGAIAKKFRTNGDYAKSIEIYQQLLTKATTNLEKQSVNAGMAKAKARLNGAANSSDVDAILQQLIADKQNIERLGYHIFQIGEEYYLRAVETKKDNKEQAWADFQKAIAVWDLNIKQINDPKHKCYGYYYSAVACREIGDYLKAIEYLNKVLSDYPESDKVCGAQSAIADSYYKLYKAKVISKKQAAGEVQSIYQSAIEKNSDSSSLPLIRTFLKKLQ